MTFGLIIIAVGAIMYKVSRDPVEEWISVFVVILGAVSVIAS